MTINITYNTTSTRKYTYSAVDWSRILHALGFKRSGENAAVRAISHFHLPHIASRYYPHQREKERAKKTTRLGGTGFSLCFGRRAAKFTLSSFSTAPCHSACVRFSPRLAQPLMLLVMIADCSRPLRRRLDLALSVSCPRSSTVEPVRDCFYEMANIRYLLCQARSIESILFENNKLCLNEAFGSAGIPICNYLFDEMTTSSSIICSWAMGGVSVALSKMTEIETALAKSQAFVQSDAANSLVN